VEDDLLFSPDFYEYFNYVAPILDLDKSLFVISAWNDNGFKGKVEDSLALKRTEFFPGLGWLLPKTLYKVAFIAIIYYYAT
jgi:alpha-1,3-mannosyl-glycoprotein beta-1,2-N-acetylglucosaminyltransferase